jgi:2-phospho-L-lactate guanylyltransferase
VRWTVLIPAKSLPAAKSRLLGASADAPAHARLVEAIRADTLAAVAAVPEVARVVVVTDRRADLAPAPGQAAGPGRAEQHVVVQQAAGLNAALREGAAHARHAWPDDAVVALMADLPALRPAELHAALTLADTHRSAFVPDTDGSGTTMLSALPGVELDPQFGVGSAVRHAARATALDAGPGLRRDVDTAEDLQAAAGLGVGPRTAAELNSGDTIRSTSPGMMSGMCDCCRPGPNA